MKTKTDQKTLLLLFIFLFVVPIQTSHGQTHTELIPSISASQGYDDNIYLAPSNEQSDYISLVTPNLALNLVSQHTKLSFSYAPTFVRYADNTDKNTTRHSGTVNFSQELSRQLSFNLADTYVKSEDPLETTQDVEQARQTRNTYQRNNGNVGLVYRFGPENELSAGYLNSYLNNNDNTVDDGRIQNPFVSMNYNFNVQNSLSLKYGYKKADFWNQTVDTNPDPNIDTRRPAKADFIGNETDARYTYKFTQHTSGFLDYALTTRNFDGASEDYKVHNGAIGFDHAFSPDMNVSASGGYFVRQNENSKNNTGYTYQASLSKAFKRGTISVGGSGGWAESYLEANAQGFVKYWSANSRLEYQILEPLSGYMSGNYRHEKAERNNNPEAVQPNGNSDTVRGSLGLTWNFFRWFSLALDYTHAERSDTEGTTDYRDNRISLVLTASRLFKW